MKKISKVFIVSFCFSLFIVSSFMLQTTNALSDEMSVELNIADFKAGDSVIVYEDEEKGIQLVVDFLLTKEGRVSTGTGAWSGGTLPSNTVTMYPHFEDKNYDYTDIGFYVTYDGKYRKYIGYPYSETIGSLWEISAVSSKIVTRQATTTVPAKAQMNWVREQNGSSISCYLRQDINYSGQTRLAWRI